MQQRRRAVRGVKNGPDDLASGHPACASTGAWTSVLRRSSQVPDSSGISTGRLETLPRSDGQQEGARVHERSRTFVIHALDRTGRWWPPKASPATCCRGGQAADEIPAQVFAAGAARAFTWTTFLPSGWLPVARCSHLEYTRPARRWSASEPSCSGWCVGAADDDASRPNRHSASLKPSCDASNPSSA